MHPRQMRETVIPVLPNFEYCMISPNCFFRFSLASRFRARTAKTPALARACQGRSEMRSDCDGRDSDFSVDRIELGRAIFYHPLWFWDGSALSVVSFRQK